MARDPFENFVATVPSPTSTASPPQAVNDPFDEVLSNAPTVSPVTRFMRHPLIETGALLSRIPGPLRQTALPLLGAIAGSRLPVPFASTALAAGGGALSGAIEASREASDRQLGALPEGAGGRIATEAALSAPLGLAAGAPAYYRSAKDIVPAARLHQAIDVTGGAEKAAPRHQFLQRLIGEIAEVPKHSGKAVGQHADELLAQYPERAQALTSEVANVVPTIRTLFEENSGLRNAVARQAQVTKRMPTLQKFFPEFTGREPGLTSEEQEVIRMSVGQRPADLSTMTFDDVQHLKKLFGDVAYKTARSPGESIGGVELDALQAWGRLREAEIAVHPELHEEFLRHHAVMSNFEEVKPYLKREEKLQAALQDFFKGDTPAQVGATELLRTSSPQTLRKMRHFASAYSMQTAKRVALFRAGRYLMFIPLYTLFGMMRREMGRRR